MQYVRSQSDAGTGCSVIQRMVQTIVQYCTLLFKQQANGMDTEKYMTELFSQPAGTILLPWKD